mmetsp:Transcript_31894/g.32137  ORF Transcript_31894/g.32137 Transcript_31894/m.32137 type:complete len:270 (+) Transcript_31894:463-1272(+)
MGNCNELLIKFEIASHLLLPPAGYFLVAFAKHVNSSLLHGFIAVAFFFSSSAKAAFLRFSRRCAASFFFCVWFPSLVSVVTVNTNFMASKVSRSRRASIKSLSSSRERDVQSNSTSSFMVSRLLFHRAETVGFAKASMVSFRRDCFALRRSFFSRSFLPLADSFSFFSAMARIASSFFSTSSFSFLTFSSASNCNFFSFSFPSFSNRSIFRNRFNLGSAAMARSTNVLIRPISSFFKLRLFLSISFNIHRFSSRQSAVSVSCSVNSAAL